MTAYVTIPNTDIDAESPIDADLMTAMRDNPIAITEGASGAPKIQDAAIDWTTVVGSVGQTQIGALAVGQGELKTATGTLSTTAVTVSNQTLPGGEYGFHVRLRTSGTNPAEIAPATYYYATHNTTSYLTRISFRITGGAETAYILQRYIQASPPYDLGDGEIPLFTFAVVDNTTGNIESVYSAPEAPWHYNGPTDIRAEYIRKDGMPCRMVTRAKFECCVNNIDLLAMLKDPAQRDQALALLADKQGVELEIRQEIKNKDISLVPHPFQGNDLTGKTVVMLDPICDQAWQLGEINAVGESVNEILHDGYITLDNTALPRVTPEGVITVAASWKNSG